MLLLSQGYAKGEGEGAVLG